MTILTIDMNMKLVRQPNQKTENRTSSLAAQSNREASFDLEQICEEDESVELEQINLTGA
eukprot:COSAG02_NODE_687_length_18478_cov_23.093476_11_plen_60_part_00